jgi:hypothetical protein
VTVILRSPTEKINDPMMLNETKLLPDSFNDFEHDEKRFLNDENDP